VNTVGIVYERRTGPSLRILLGRNYSRLRKRQKAKQIQGIACQRTRLDIGLPSYDTSLRGQGRLLMRWESSMCWSGLINLFEYHTMDISTRVDSGPSCPQCFFSPRNVSASVKKIIRQLDERMRKHNDKNPNIPLKIVLTQGYSLIFFSFEGLRHLRQRKCDLCEKQLLVVPGRVIEMASAHLGRIAAASHRYNNCLHRYLPTYPKS